MESVLEVDFAKLRSEGGIDVIWMVDKQDDGSDHIQHNCADGTYRTYELGGDEVVDHGGWTMEEGNYKEQTRFEVQGVLHGDSSGFYMDVDCGPHGSHKYKSTSEHWIRGHRAADAVDLVLARQQLPMAHMLPDQGLTKLVQLSTPTDLRSLDVLKYIASFDSIQTNDALEIVAVSAQPKVSSLKSWNHGVSKLEESDDFYLRFPREVEVETEVETVKLKTPVSTKDIPVLSWLQQLLTAVTDTIKALFLEASASEAPLHELFGRYPVSVITLVCRVRFTELIERSLAEGQLGTLTQKVQAIATGMKEALKSGQDPTRRGKLELLMPIIIFQEKSAERLQHIGENAPYAALWDVWRQYVRHYKCDNANHPVTVKCGEAEIQYGFQYRGCKLQVV